MSTGSDEYGKWTINQYVLRHPEHGTFIIGVWAWLRTSPVFTATRVYRLPGASEDPVAETLGNSFPSLRAAKQAVQNRIRALDAVRQSADKED